MISAALDHLWQSTLFGLAIAILAMAFRNARASVRYGLWLAASVKFLIPFAALGVLGRLLAPAIRPPLEANALFIARAAEPFSPPVHLGAPVAQAGAWPDLTPALLGVWALGFAIVLAIWTVRWARIHPFLRLATPVALAAPMPVLATPTMMEPGLVGLWRPVLLLPEALFEHMDRPGIEALVAHEACHFRRRDNLTAAVHMLVETLFWFHPMVWWIGGRLVDERERACDEAVVRSGHDPVVYAESLLQCCRLFLQSPLRCVAGASGSNLTRRVETIMTSPLRSSLSRSGKAMLVAAGVCAAATPVVAGWLTSPAQLQVAARIVAIASSPASALAQEPSTTVAPARGQTANTITPSRMNAAPSASAKRIVALVLEPMHLDPSADSGSAPALEKPLLSSTTAETPDARLVPISDTGPEPKVYCMLARPPSAPPSGPKVKRLCMTADQWKQAVVSTAGKRDCWAGRYGCTPDGDVLWGVGPVGASTFPQPGPGDYAQPQGYSQDIHFGPPPTYSFVPPPPPQPAR
jgi:beta-lactamase regulating signal transducer with metallopeptidase domain